MDLRPGALSYIPYDCDRREECPFLDPCYGAQREPMTPTPAPYNAELTRLHGRKSKTMPDAITSGSAKPSESSSNTASKPIDLVNHPPHYTKHPSGVECITVTEHMGFNLGNAVKYIWRADEKGNAVEDLKKAAWYIAREIDKRARQ